MSDWVWIRRDVLVAAHEEQLAEHGGPSGIRDEAMLDSALMRPVNKASYGEVTVAELAAAYAYGLAKNHPFVDGNKRASLIAMELFLVLNGYELVASEEMCVITILSLAEGTLDETELTNWINENLEEL